MSYIRVMKNLSIILKSAVFVAAVCVWFPSAGQNPVRFVSKVVCIDSLRVVAAVRPIDQVLEHSPSGWMDCRNTVKSSAAALARIFPLSSSNTVRLVYSVRPSGRYDMDRAFGITMNYIDHMFDSGGKTVRVNDQKCRRTGDIDLRYKYMLSNGTYVGFHVRLTVIVELFNNAVQVRIDMEDILTYTYNKNGSGIGSGNLRWLHDRGEMDDIMYKRSDVRFEYLVAYIKACEAMMKSVTWYIDVMNIEMNQPVLSYNK